MISADKRRYPRVRYLQDVLINRAVPAAGASISQGGMFLFTTAPFRSDHQVRVQFMLHELSMELASTVRHYQPGIGMGLMFQDLSEEQEMLVKVYVDDALQEQAQVRTKKVLLLDNNALKRRLYRIALEQSHYHVVEATAIAQVFDILKSDTIGALVFDPHVPGGYTLVKRLRINPSWNTIVPIVLSSRPVAEETRRRELPAVRHLFLQSGMPPTKLPRVIAKYVS